MSIIVSVVIPTHNRPQLVKRAVNSVRAQTLHELEIIVVIDGEDPTTIETLAAIAEPRLRIVRLSESRGGGAARNMGVANAKGEWIAFLDDDDEWFPTKLERQLAVATTSSHFYPIISCYLTAKTPKGEFTYPKRLPTANEHLSEYLLARNSWYFGEGLIQTSTIFTPKKLLQQVPFNENLAKHQDWDWILRVNLLPEVGVTFVTETLAIWYIWEQRQTTSSKSNWRNSLAWIDANRHLVTPRAYSSFLIAQVAPQAASEAQWQLFARLLQDAFRFGKLKPHHLGLYLGMWLIPKNLRRSLRALRYSFKPKMLS
ncbi:glycosyltransferase family 2 protein [Myxosarcina sp. GI1(2024)]